MPDLSGPERAAIMIMYLERPIAQRLLQKLGDDEIRAIGMAMSKIEQIPHDVIEEVVRTFIQDLSQSVAVPNTGPDFVSNVLPGLLDDDRKSNIIPMLRRRVDQSFQRFIAERPAGAVAALLRDERPQAQAVALSLMGNDNAARILKHMSEDEQLEVTLRMARLKHIPGELADDVTTALREALGQLDDQLEVGGVDSTARTLAKMRRSENDAILFAVEDEDFDLADQLRRRMVVFEDLAQLNGRSVQVLLKQVEREDLLAALKGAEPEMRELFLSNVSKRAAEDMREEIEIMEDLPRSRVRAAQEAIVAAAMKLAEDNSIYLPIGSDDDEEG